MSFALLKSALLFLPRSSSISRNVCFLGDNTEAGHEVAKVLEHC